MRGYSIRMAEAIREADGNLLGVQLGRACLARDISVTDVAKALGVTRQTIYSWFTGAGEPKDFAREAIRTYISSLN